MISIYTPSHDPKYLDDAYQSLYFQTFKDWELIVLLNGGAHWSCEDPRVHIFRTEQKAIGALKKEAVDLCMGDIFVELDHDDKLEPQALERIFDCLAHSLYEVCYSDFAQMTEDGTPNHDRWNGDWTYREENGWLVCNSPEPLPHNLGYVWYAPNHVRAFTRSAYYAVGGYDPNLDILDDQDLMIRLFMKYDFYHIKEFLYKQRIHDGNTQKDPLINARIQELTVHMYDQNIEQLALAWAKRNKLKALDLGGAHNPAPGYLIVDINDPANLLGDVFDVLSWQDNNSVGVIRASDFLEHIPDKIRLFNEFYRVLAHGGMLLTNTPSTDGRGAYQDPTHVSFYNENSFWYFTDQEYRKYVPEITAKFMQSRLVTYFPSDWHVEHKIPYVLANLVAIKG